MSQNSNQPDLKVFDTGMVRSKDAEPYAFHLLSPIAKRAWAMAYKEGEIKYSAFNCEKGAPALDFINHAEKHINDWLSGDRSEDHLGHAMWNVGMAIHSVAMWPHLNLDMRREGCIPPTVDDETAASWKNLAANLESMKRDVKEAAKGPVAGEEIKEGDLVHIYPGGKLRVVRHGQSTTSRHTPVRYHFVAEDWMRSRLLAFRSDLQWEGHEVITHWLDGPIDGDRLELDYQSCDTIVFFVTRATQPADKVRKYGKPIVAIGICPVGFPEAGRDERYFPDWESFLGFLEACRSAANQTPVRR